MTPALRRAVLPALALGVILGQRRRLRQLDDAGWLSLLRRRAPLRRRNRPAAQSSSGPSAKDVAEQPSALFPVPNPRDNTGACAPACVQLITTDAVSVYRWTDEASAKRFAGTGTDVDVVGPFALSYKGREQQATSRQARAAYRAKVGELLGR